MIALSRDPCAPGSSLNWRVWRRRRSVGSARRRSSRCRNPVPGERGSVREAQHLLDEAALEQLESDLLAEGDGVLGIAAREDDPSLADAADCGEELLLPIALADIGHV